MITCKKRQRMVTNGKEEYRCIHKDSDLYGQIVETICEECPLNGPKKNWDKQCGRCASRDIINDKTANCRMYGKTVTWQECKVCLTKPIEISEKIIGVLENGEIIENGEETFISTILTDSEKALLANGKVSRKKDLETILKNEKEYPSLITQANNYRLAVTRWIKAGRPKRTDDEIKIIHEKHCKKCDWYDKKSSRCKGCGCRVVPKGLALTNKLKMATEHCPRQLF